MRRSLRSRLTLVVMVCWSVPLLFIWLTNLQLSTSSLRERIDASLREGADFAASQVSSRLNAVIAMSRRASYDDVIYNAYLEMSGGKPDMLEIYTGVRKTLTNAFDRNSLVTFAAVYFHGLEDDYMSFEERASRIETMRSFETDMPDIMACAAKSGGAISFCLTSGRLYIVRNLMTKTGMDEFGTLVALMNPDSLSAPFRHMNLTETRLSVRLADYLNQNPVYITEAVPELETLSFGHDSLVRDGGKVSLTRRLKYQDYTLSYYVEVDYDDSYPELFSTRKLTGFLILGVLPLLIYMLRFLHVQVTRPVQGLVRVAESIEGGDFGVQTKNDCRLNYEFEYLSSSVNSMSIRLKELFERVYREELRFKDAKIAALQAQINPHFFNNTLELINWQARRNGDEFTSRLIESLATLVSMAMDRSEARRHPLKAELECVDAYLYIASVRFGKRLTIKRDIAESLLDTPVPRMFMQPLVENAVVHSLDRLDNATVSIKVFERGGRLIVEIGNSGALSDADRAGIDAILATTIGTIDDEGRRRMGLANVYERLLLMFNDPSVLSYREDDDFTTIEVTMPLGEKL